MRSAAKPNAQWRPTHAEGFLDLSLLDLFLLQVPHRRGYGGKKSLSRALGVVGGGAYVLAAAAGPRLPQRREIRTGLGANGGCRRLRPPWDAEGPRRRRRRRVACGWTRRR